MIVRTIFFVALISFIARPASADGWPFVGGRSPGPVTVLTLTKEQRAFIDLAWRCRSHKTNVRTPYIFKLTSAQSAILKKEASFSPERFAIFESYKGDKGSDLDLNIINRFSEDKFEIPHKLLEHDAEAHDWEINIMGWKPNPLENMNPKDIKPDTKCP